MKIYCHYVCGNDLFQNFHSHVCEHMYIYMNDKNIKLYLENSPVNVYQATDL